LFNSNLALYTEPLASLRRPLQSRAHIVVV